MLIDFLATIAAGIGVACLVFVANHLGFWLTGRKLGKWVLPAGIGLGMLGYAIWNEYTWYPRVRAALPEGMVVAVAPEERAVYRPWSYLRPSVSRFIAVDRGPATRSADDPQIFAANALVMQRWMPAHRIPQAFDCARRARADLIDGAVLNPDGTLTGTTWTAAADDPLVAAACDGG
jgi:hypothetical protein